MVGKKDGEGEDNKVKVDGKVGGFSNKKVKKDKVSIVGFGIIVKFVGFGSVFCVKVEFFMFIMLEEVEK